MTKTSTQLLWRRGTTSQNDAFIGGVGEITVDISSWQLRIHDGVTPGGHVVTGGSGSSGSITGGTANYIVKYGGVSSIVTSSLFDNGATITTVLPITATAFSGSLYGTASQAVSASYALSSSYAVTSSFALSSSVAVSASFAVSSSRASSAFMVDVISGGSATGYGGYTGSFTGSFTGSYRGDGSLLMGIVAANSGTTIADDGVTQGNAAVLNFQSGISATVAGGTGSVNVVFPSGLVSSSMQINTGSYTGSFTGSLLGTASRATSASYAVTASFALNAGLSPGMVSSSSQIDHNATTNYVADQHVAHSSIGVIAGSGLSGGGTINASVTLNVGTGLGIVVNADDVAISTGSAHFITGSVRAISGAIITPFAVTSSLFGTASWATSASRAVTASRADSSFAVDVVSGGSATGTGSYTGSFTGSFSGAFNGTITSASNAVTASFALNAITTLSSGVVSSSRQFMSASDPFTGSFNGTFTGNGAGLTSVAVSYGNITGLPSLVSSSAQVISHIQGQTISPLGVSASNITVTSSFNINTPLATVGLQFQSNSINRVIMRLDNTDVWSFAARDITGSLIDGPISINLAAGNSIRLARPVTASSGIYSTFVSASALTGSLFGTASWATTSSFALSSSYVLPAGLPAGTVSSSTQMPVATFANGADDRLLTATSTTAITGEPALTFNGTQLVNLSGSVISGQSDLQSTATFILRASGSQNRSLRFESNAGSLRWQWLVQTTESGGDAGSNMFLGAYTDSASLIDAPITIFRAAGGSMTMTRPLTLNSNMKITGSIAIGTTTANFTAVTGSLLVTGSASITGSTVVLGQLSANAFVGTTATTSDLSGSLNVASGIGSSDAFVQIGNGRTASGSAYIDLIGDTAFTDFGLRILRSASGSHATSSIIHRGTGSLFIGAQDTGSVQIFTNNITRLSINSFGVVAVSGSMTAGGTITATDFILA